MGSIPSASRASTSPSARAVPNWMTLAAPARESAISPVRSGPNSRPTTVTITVPRYAFAAPTRVRSETVWPMTTNPSAIARKTIIGNRRSPAVESWPRTKGRITLGAWPNLVNMTPIVISAKALRPCRTLKNPTTLRPKKSMKRISPPFGAGDAPLLRTTSPFPHPRRQSKVSGCEGQERNGVRKPNLQKEKRESTVGVLPILDLGLATLDAFPAVGYVATQYEKNNVYAKLYPLRRGTNRPRRTRLRHLFPTFGGSHRVPRHTGG